MHYLHLSKSDAQRQLNLSRIANRSRCSEIREGIEKSAVLTLVVFGQIDEVEDQDSGNLTLSHLA
jgi:hypothetical protein